MIEPLGKTVEWQSARSAAEREAVAGAWVRRGQSTTGTEHLAVLDMEANLVRVGCSGKAASVFVGDLPKNLNVVLHHSHPAEVSLSGADLVAAWRQSAGSEVRAYTPGGGVFRGRCVIRPELWTRARQRAVEAAGSELRILGRHGNARLTDAAAHLVNAELARVGLIWYRFELSSAAEAVLRSIADDVRAVHSVIRGVLATES